MTPRKLQPLLALAVLTVSIIFSMSPSWSGTEEILLQPGLQILKSEIMAIIITVNDSQPAPDRLLHPQSLMISNNS